MRMGISICEQFIIKSQDLRNVEVYCFAGLLKRFRLTACESRGFSDGGPRL